MDLTVLILHLNLVYFISDNLSNTILNLKHAPTQSDVRIYHHLIMKDLCNDHRIELLHNRSTEFSIHEFHLKYYQAFEFGYFKRLLKEIASINKEIDIDGNYMRLTDKGVVNCKQYDSVF